MPKLSTITDNIVPITSGPSSYPRRPLSSFWAGLTCLALVVHQESKSKKALLVSDDGDPIGAVWVPKAMLVTDKVERGRFIVATMSASFANQKRLNVRLIDAEKHNYTAEEQVDLQDAVHCAALSRNRLRGSQQSSMGYMGRNSFA